MSIPNKAYMAEYKAKNKERLSAQQQARDAKKREARNSDPVARAEYLAKRRQEYLKTHPNAKTMEEYRNDQSAIKTAVRRVRKQNKPTVVIDGVPMRVCEDCGMQKPLENFSRHGSNGHKGVCKTCSKPAPKKVKKELPHFVVTTERKPVKVPDPAFKTSWDAKLLDEGWVKVIGHTDPTEWIKAYVRNGVILYVRGQLGSYSAGKQSFGVLFDDSGKRYPTLGAAEKVAKRMMA